MARILFTWELGGGLGHTRVHLGLARRLRAMGHDVAFAVRDLTHAEETFGPAAIPYLQAPVRIRPMAGQVAAARTYAHVLHNVGLGDPQGLAGQLRAWRALYRLVRPDLIAFDHSPTALLAARGLSVPRAVLGSGFIVPPRLTPFPDLRSDPPPPGWSPEADEGRLLGAVNQVLARLGDPPLEALADILQAEATFLLTFPELDHYPSRPGARYWGAGSSGDGEAPVWPAGDGPRLFAYLKPCKTLPAVLDTLQGLGCRTLAYAPDVPIRLRRQAEGPWLRFAPGPVDLDQAGRACDLALLNATHDSTAAMLLAGRPILQLPLALEQLITAHATARLGAGLAVPDGSPEGVRTALSRLLAAPQGFLARAQDFARRYAGFHPGRREEEMAATLDELAGSTGPPERDTT